jgi:prepilin-type N-terminal cleavage/methylation domain-containing protein/prepilin-type processing-associated H-X9-DG protein
MKRTFAMNKKAFTLVELLVVIAVIGILAGLLLPTLSKTKESGKSIACLNNLHQIGIGLQLYVSDNQNLLPSMDNVSTNTPPGTGKPPINVVLLTYVGGNSNVFGCPSDNENQFLLTGSSYFWNNLLNGQDAEHLEIMDTAFPLQQIPVVFDKDKFHVARGDARAINFLYADGHLKNLMELQNP